LWTASNAPSPDLVLLFILVVVELARHGPKQPNELSRAEEAHGGMMEGVVVFLLQKVVFRVLKKHAHLGGGGGGYERLRVKI
jgi:hypothetical protein